MIATTIASPTMITYGASAEVINHPKYKEVRFQFRPQVSDSSATWQTSDMRVELIAHDGIPEVHVFGPVMRWTFDQYRDWRSIEKNVLRGILVEKIFEEAVLDLLM
jgi:hypothetical protein